jgi:2-dehydro-3-deoxyphosphogluconate aldolase/(4S)-4-hydroxy-2-oxoglutarate aldolase
MGAFTPTEIYTAHRAGADLVKVFPASSVDPGYLRAVRAPFPDLRLVPTGGVGVENAGEWLAAGAVALGIGGGLTNAAAIAAGRYDELSDYAARLMASLEATPQPERARA